MGRPVLLQQRQRKPSMRVFIPKLTPIGLVLNLNLSEVRYFRDLVRAIHNTGNKKACVPASLDICTFAGPFGDLFLYDGERWGWDASEESRLLQRSGRRVPSMVSETWISSPRPIR